MIDPRELRIGNLVKQAFATLTITAIGSKHAYATDHNRKGKVTYENIDPIHLTPEILEACGFTHNPNFKYPDKSTAERWVNGFYLIGKHYTGEGYGIEWIIGGGHSVCPIHLIHLHQLQNLIFANTGKELTINLPVTT